jgi:hypothetical protein
MSLPRSDLDQAVRYLRYARELLDREALVKRAILRETLQMAVRR